MCFVTIGTFKPKRTIKKSKAQSSKDVIETYKHIMSSDNSFSRIINQINSYAPKSMFQSMIEDDIRNKQMGFK